MLRSSSLVATVFAMSVAVTAGVAPARSQLIPDATLPTPSQVAPIAPDVFRITGGTPADTNLFHSFTQFDLGAGEVAQFDFSNFDRTIANAIIRVTGGQFSQIDGAIVAEGSTNLVFVNPQGWVFGAGAQLDVGGAIAFSSAEAVVFADGSAFPSVATPGSETLLSVAVPIGLQLGAGSPNRVGDIEITGNGHDLSVTHPILAPIERNGATDGLRGSPANLLMLAGDTVSINGGTVTAASGQLSIVAGRNGLVPLGMTIDHVDPVRVQNPAFELGDISLTNAALLDVTGPVSGRMDLIGDRIQLTAGSIVLAQQFDDSVPEFPGSGLFVHGDREIFVSGMTADGRLQTRINSATLQGSRRGSDVVIRTGDLIVTDGAAIVTRSFSQGRGGDLIVETTNSVQLLDVNPIVADFFSNLTATSLVAGRAGDLSVTTDRIVARNGGTIASSTFGLGDGGNVSITARDRIDLTGVDLRQFSPSVIIASSFGQGNAGNLAIQAPEITLSTGGRIDASSFNSGTAGSVTITADRLTVTGIVPGSVNPSLIVSSANVLDPALRALLNVPEIPTGDAGDVQLVVDHLEVRDGATVTVRNDGTGDAGRLQIVADRVNLSDRGSLSAATTSGEGGNIVVQVSDSLQLRNMGAISATAGGTGNGGNLTLTAATILALDNSDITANAVTGRGGNVEITTQGLFGATLRSSLTPASDITASSNFGLAGRINLETPDLSSNQGAMILSTQPLNTDTLVQPHCREIQRGQFAITGRSGQPFNPMNSYGQPIPTAILPQTDSRRIPDPPPMFPGDRARPSVSLENLGTVEAGGNSDNSVHVENLAGAENSDNFGNSGHTDHSGHSSHFANRRNVENFANSDNAPTFILESQGWQHHGNGIVELVNTQSRSTVTPVSSCQPVHPTDPSLHLSPP
ncbi:MAG: filamentous hemagglutinin N-terminal domain-containing protein [Oscillatoriales cyanobacterium]|nr:MAG: filamentous hemagglutinin N-terminal domain-containing protein [Oscillatoriales cyanobacterium]